MPSQCVHLKIYVSRNKYVCMYLRVIFYSHQYVQDSEFQIEIGNYICTYTKYYLNHYDPIFENIICLKIQYDVSYEPNLCKNDIK